MVSDWQRDRQETRGEIDGYDVCNKGPLPDLNQGHWACTVTIRLFRPLKTIEIKQSEK